MGYNLHITRKELWADKESAGIALEEWLNYMQKEFYERL